MVALTLFVGVVLGGCHATAAADINYRRAAEGDAPVGGIGTVAAKARTFAGGARSAPAFGADVALGGAHPGGFAWRAAGYPIGAGRRIGGRGVVGLVGGLGASGVTGHVAGALEFPVELFTTLRLGKRTAVAAWVQPAWLPFSDTRDDGAPDVPFVDELRTGVTFRFDRRVAKWRAQAAGGYHLGLIYGEELGARFIGVTVGYDLDASASAP